MKRVIKFPIRYHKNNQRSLKPDELVFQIYFLLSLHLEVL